MSPPTRETAISIAARLDHYDIAKVLIDHGANINLSLRSFIWFPIFNAVEAEKPDLTSLLIENGSYINVKNFNGLTPLRHAIVHNENQSQIIVLLRNRSDLNLKDYDGNNEIEGALDMKKMKALKLIAYHMST